MTVYIVKHLNKLEFNTDSLQQKVEYFTKILRLIMSLHRDIMELQLQCRDAMQYQRPPPAYGISPKLKAEIAMKWQREKLKCTVSIEVPQDVVDGLRTEDESRI